MYMKDLEFRKRNFLVIWQNLDLDVLEELSILDGFEFICIGSTKNVNTAWQMRYLGEIFIGACKSNRVKMRATKVFI